MKRLRLNLVIRANNVELHDDSATNDKVVKSVSIDKGDVETALKECYVFIRENKSLSNKINFLIPSEQIKIFIKHVDKEDYKNNINTIAENFLKNEKNIDISASLYNIVGTENSLEISVINRENLLEAITFIENIGFKVVNAVGNLNDQKRFFVFDTKLEFESASPSRVFIQGTKFLRAIVPKIFSTSSWINFRIVRSVSIFGIALIATITLATAYFDRSPKNEPLIKAEIQIEKALITENTNDETEEKVLKLLDVFLLSQKINFPENQDKAVIKEVKNSSEPKRDTLPSNLVDKSLVSKSVYQKSLDLVYADQSEIKIKNPNLQIAVRDDESFLTEISKDRLLTSISGSRGLNDPSINFSNNITLPADTEVTYSRPDLNLKLPVNEMEIKKLSKAKLEIPKNNPQENINKIKNTPPNTLEAMGISEKKKFDRMMANFQTNFNEGTPARPRIRPNKYPFEIKEEFARPRVRPDVIEVIAAKSQIFSDNQLGQSVKPKIRPKFRKRIVASAATKKSIVKLATQKNAINKRKLNVLSIYSRGSEKRAIVLFPTGQTKLVKVGDTLDGGRVAAIGTTEIRYIKGGNNLVLKIPQG
ncbi:MAG: hypothetical protein QGF19_01115 [Paracoccaceae bacterium]|nr:hypothetical protein [Paracoccaceae bacterium]